MVLGLCAVGRIVSADGPLAADFRVHQPDGSAPTAGEPLTQAAQQRSACAPSRLGEDLQSTLRPFTGRTEFAHVRVGLASEIPRISAHLAVWSS
jgi:hypothetical protein